MEMQSAEQATRQIVGKTLMDRYAQLQWLIISDVKIAFVVSSNNWSDLLLLVPSQVATRAQCLHSNNLLPLQANDCYLVLLV